MFHNISFKWCF